MDAESAGGQVVTERNLNHIVLAHTAGHQHARHEIGPGLDVVARVPHDDRHARRGVNAHDLAQGHGEQAIGVVGLQILAGRERQAPQVIERAHVVGIDAAAVETLAVERHVQVRAHHDRLQRLQLERGQRVLRHALSFWFVDHGRHLPVSMAASASRSRPR